MLMNPFSVTDVGIR